MVEAAQYEAVGGSVVDDTGKEIPREPYLMAAAICERVIQDSESGGYSLINLYDRLTVRANTFVPLPTPEIPVPLTLTVFVAFRTSGSYTATHRMTIRVLDPHQRTHEIAGGEVEFGVGNGTNITAKVQIVLTSDGFYYFDFWLEERFLTRIPLEIVYDSSPSNPSEGEDQAEGPTVDSP